MTASPAHPVDVFTQDEYDARLATVRSRMELQGLSALLVVDPANIYYLTGYNAWSFYTPQLLFVPTEGDMILFSREMDAHGAHRTSWLPEGSIVGYPERYVQRPHLHPFDWVAFAIRQRFLVPAGSRGAVGLEMDAHFLTPKAYRALYHALPEWKIVDCFELVNWVRVVKSDTEIEVMRQAARVTTTAMDAAIEAIEPGVPQNVVAARIASAQALGDGDAWGDYPAIVPMLPTGESGDTPHLTWSNHRIERHEPVIIELTGAHRRYHVPLARTVVLEKPSADLAHVEEAVAAGLQAMLETMAPEVSVRQLAQAWNWALAEYGLAKESRLGYSIGIGFPPDWGERTISIRSEDESVLQPNMTFHLICGMWLDGLGYEVSESVRVTDTGVEAFTSFPRSLIRK